MTGAEIATLMQNSELKRAIHKIARRYSKRIEDIEEYIQDAWLRIAACEEGDKDHYCKEALRAIRNAYERKRYVVGKKKRKIPNGSNRER